MQSRTFIAALLSASLLSQPVLADRGRDDYRRHDNGYHNGWDHRWDPHGWRAPRKVIYESIRPPVDYVYLNNRVPTTYSQIRCTNTVNPLGLLLGGAAGGIVGHQIGKGTGKTAATIGGAVIGSAIGANSYSERCTEEVFQQAPVGMPIVWQNSRDYYQVTPVREYQTSGRYCREYQARATVGGRTQDTYGTACMQPDGSWEIVN